MAGGNEDDQDQGATAAPYGDTGDTGLSLIDEEQAEQVIRKAWHEGRWCYSVIDVVGFLTESKSPRHYWATLKRRLAEEGGAEALTNCQQLKLRSADGKLRETDCADTETLLRIVQSVPSPRAEPF
jgi:hypothetical protein